MVWLPTLKPCRMCKTAAYLEVSRFWPISTELPHEYVAHCHQCLRMSRPGKTKVEAIHSWNVGIMRKLNDLL